MNWSMEGNSMANLVLQMRGEKRGPVVFACT